jgi:DNA-binding transcriptional MerR regulator
LSKRKPIHEPIDTGFAAHNLHTEPHVPLSPVDSVTPDAGLHRIGTVSRLAGVPVTTLRVWEARHAAFAPSKTAGSHRLYADADVVRARVLRQLTEAGHSIGGIARLPVGELQRLLEQSRDAMAPAPVVAARQVTVIAIGSSLASRLDAPGLQQELGARLRVGHVFTSLDEAEAHAASTPAADEGDTVVVVARLNTVHDGNHAQLLRVLEQAGARGAVVLYNYGAPPALDAMRAAGLVVRREPVAAPDFAQLIRSMVYLGADDAAPDAPGALIPRRRYSDEALARVGASTSSILCECPRHIAELIGQLASFEEYSQACLNDSAEDARLHAHLRAISGSARAMFERALDLAVAHGGVVA